MYHQYLAHNLLVRIKGTLRKCVPLQLYNQNSTIPVSLVRAQTQKNSNFHQIKFILTAFTISCANPQCCWTFDILNYYPVWLEINLQTLNYYTVWLEIRQISKPLIITQRGWKFCKFQTLNYCPTNFDFKIIPERVHPHQFDSRFNAILCSFA